MKYLFFILFTICSVSITNAQLFTKEKVQNLQTVDKARLSWGYYLGFNNLDFKFDYKDNLGDIQTERTIGFNVGLIGNLRINDHFDLRLEPGLVISQRNLNYPLANFENFEDEISDSDLLREVKSTYVYFPLLLKISTKRVNNIKPFILTGLSTAINLSSNEKNPDDNSAGEFRMKKNMQFYELGLGIDFYLDRFKFTPSIRGVFALNDEIIRDKDPNSPWTSNIESMQTRGFFINFTVQ
ncbi:MULTISPECIES: type IX secretion/gliding motility protein PorT/SprT [Mesoflavibacter]|uniref:PorT family protein n=1 Tax=Mesoflavibacter profundi TaxID=2708110 RepID=A0ABT4S0C7_9FLAO|nr:MULTISPECIES: porin family protein [Mesoflavibacter]MDA0177497.1 PorT family protein [Mesoflavibacter profundi]QIJ88452.1 PorT protein [Mesoflavibacter sp. HG96]QIJ91180.1 PorT protein [Mesoflavibacter sp. HG37]